MKEIKAWAVVDRRGRILIDSISEARENCEEWVDEDNGEWIVRVTVRVEE